MDACINFAVDMVEVTVRAIFGDTAGALVSGVRAAVNGVRCINPRRFTPKRREIENMKFFRRLG
jgi:hypothetical protein